MTKDDVGLMPLQSASDPGYLATKHGKKMDSQNVESAAELVYSLPTPHKENSYQKVGGSKPA